MSQKTRRCFVKIRKGTEEKLLNDLRDLGCSKVLVNTSSSIGLEFGCTIKFPENIEGDILEYLKSSSSVRMEKDFKVK